MLTLNKNLGGFECYCWEGFEGTGVFGDCHNIDECSFYEMADGGAGQDLMSLEFSYI